MTIEDEIVCSSFEFALKVVAHIGILEIRDRDECRDHVLKMVGGR